MFMTDSYIEFCDLLHRRIFFSKRLLGKAEKREPIQDLYTVARYADNTVALPIGQRLGHGFAA